MKPAGESQRMKFVNSFLNGLVRTEVRALHRSWPAFRVCGYVGFVAAVIVAMILGSSPAVIAALILSAVFTFFGLVLATRIITGEKRIVYYHHEIAVTAVATLLLWLLGRPVLPYLDVTILAIGVFLVCGRIGCLMVGCCHGRPSRWGVCYSSAHADSGFTPYYIGVRLFPIQAVESLSVLCIVAIGVSYVLVGYPPGTALGWYTITYGLGRFGFEFLRGDPERPYFCGFSQPQWISLLLMCGAVSAELFGALPLHLWHIGPTVFVAMAMIAIGFRRRLSKTAKHQLLHPHHIREVAEAVETLYGQANDEAAIGHRLNPGRGRMPGNIRVGCTSLGIQISAGEIRSTKERINHYALSSRVGGMTEARARIVAGLILQLQPAIGSSEIVQGNQGVFHLLVHRVIEKEVVC